MSHEALSEAQYGKTTEHWQYIYHHLKLAELFCRLLAAWWDSIFITNIQYKYLIQII